MLLRRTRPNRLLQVSILERRDGLVGVIAAEDQRHFHGNRDRLLSGLTVPIDLFSVTSAAQG